jgi:IMP dehydrogenase
MQIETGYGYDDLLLKPSYSALTSRSEPEIGFGFGTHSLKVPIFSAPMDTVSSARMSIFLDDMGAAGVLHRYCSIHEEVDEVKSCKEMVTMVAASVGVNGDAHDRAIALMDSGVDMLVLDVAHGHSAAVLNFIETLKGDGANWVMSANIATREAARDCIRAGADLLRVGVGAGSACTTRLVAGIGVPQLTAIMDVRDAVGEKPIIVADGGIRTSGDIVKALAAGADAVMIGGMFSRYAIAPLPGHFRGMASAEAMFAYKGQYDVAPEGAVFNTENIIEDCAAHFTELVAAIKQGFAYLGAADLDALQKNARWVQVTAMGYREGEAHFDA